MEVGISNSIKGVFGLGSHTDLFKKLEWEHAQLLAEPRNEFVAYNFFVTAWHLLEWRYPGKIDNATRERIKNANPLLQVCEHIAVGAKRFEARAQHLKSVLASKRGGNWSDGSWAEGAWGKGTWGDNLSIALTGKAEQTYGPSITADALAQHVMNYWRAELKASVT